MLQFPVKWSMKESLHGFLCRWLTSRGAGGSYWAYALIHVQPGPLCTPQWVFPLLNPPPPPAEDKVCGCVCHIHYAEDPFQKHCYRILMFNRAWQIYVKRKTMCCSCLGYRPASHASGLFSVVSGISVSGAQRWNSTFKLYRTDRGLFKAGPAPPPRELQSLSVPPTAILKAISLLLIKGNYSH